jgi:hypothetical protein
MVLNFKPLQGRAFFAQFFVKYFRKTLAENNGM